MGAELHGPRARFGARLRLMNETADRLHYLRIPDGVGGRAEMIRMTYVLAGRPYVDVLHSFGEAAAAASSRCR